MLTGGLEKVSPVPSGLLHNRRAKKKKKKKEKMPRIAVKVPQLELSSSSSSRLQFTPPRLLSGRWRCFFKGRISRTRNCPVTRGQERVMGPGREHWGSNNSQFWAKCRGLCVISFIPPAHSAGVSVAMRDNAMSVRKVTINHHMAACENAEFMFSKKLCYCMSEVDPRRR